MRRFRGPQCRALPPWEQGMRRPVAWGHPGDLIARDGDIDRRWIVPIGAGRQGADASAANPPTRLQRRLRPRAQGTRPQAHASSIPIFDCRESAQDGSWEFYARGVLRQTCTLQINTTPITLFLSRKRNYLPRLIFPGSQNKKRCGRNFISEKRYCSAKSC
jgi:hypothetical protein